MKTWAMLPRKLQILLLSTFTVSFGMNLFITFLPLYLKELGASVGQVGSYIAIMLFVQAVFRILGGWVSDNLGRLQTTALGSLFGLLGIAMMWWSPSWTWLIPGGVLMNIGISLAGTTYFAYIAECVDQGVRAQVFGFADSIFLIIRVAALPTGGYLAQIFGFRLLFALATVFMLAATGLRIWNAWGLSFGLDQLRPATLKGGLSGIGALVLGGGLLAWILVVDIIRDLGVTASYDFMQLYQQEVSGLAEGPIGWLVSIGSLANALLLTPAGRLSDRIGERKVMCIGALIYTLGLVVFTNVHSFAGYALASALINGGNLSFYILPFQALLSKSVPSNLLGLAYGIFISTVSLSSTLAPGVGAWLWENVSPRTPYHLTMFSLLVTMPIVWLKFKTPAQAVDEPKSSLAHAQEQIS
jgi:MFS family permease